MNVSMKRLCEAAEGPAWEYVDFASSEGMLEAKPQLEAIVRAVLTELKFMAADSPLIGFDEQCYVGGNVDRILFTTPET